MNRAEDYLPILINDQNPSLGGTGAGVQIGDAIISPETEWQDVVGNKEYDLLDVDTVVDISKYPLLDEVVGMLKKYGEVPTARLFASDAESGDYFGVACAIEGDRLVVGAYGEDTASSTAGTVYVYDWNATTKQYDEVPTARLFASDAESGDYFGTSCAIEGNRLVVGAHGEDTAGYDAGTVYVYDWNATTKQYDEVTTARLFASDAEVADYFGQSCALHEDRLVVGAHEEDTACSSAGTVYVYDWNATTQQYDEITSARLFASDAEVNDYFGIACAIEGDRLVVGAYGEDTASSNAGTVYVYDWNNTTKQYDEVTTARLFASDAGVNDYFGRSCALHDGRLVVSAFQEDTAGSNAGTVYVYDWNATTKQYDEVTTARLFASDAEVNDYFGVACAIEGDRLVVGAYVEDTASDDAGTVYVYDFVAVTPDIPQDPNSPFPYKIVGDKT